MNLGAELNFRHLLFSLYFFMSIVYTKPSNMKLPIFLLFFILDITYKRG
jgi:hypothetical protein